MPTINTILKELKNVPVDRLQDLYSIIQSLKADTKKPGKTNKQLLSFAGLFSDMPKQDYNEFVQETKKIRTDLFDRAHDL